MSAADSAHHGSACIATPNTCQYRTQTLTEVEIRRTDGSLHIYIYTYISAEFTDLVRHGPWEKAGVKDGKDGDEDDQVDVGCFPERKI